MKQGSSEADSLSATQKIPHLVWNLSVHYHATNSPHLASILCHTPQFHPFVPHLFDISMILSYIFDVQSNQFPSGFAVSVLFTFIFYAMRAACPANSWSLSILALSLQIAVAVAAHWSRVLPEKLIGSQLVKKFPAFCVTRRFLTAFTGAHNLSLSWARSIQSIPPSHFLKIKFNIFIPFTQLWQQLLLLLLLL